MEVRAIERHVRLKGRRILEIGSGDGRLTIQLASRAASVVAIEPDASAVKLARRQAAANGITNVSLRVGTAERVRLGLHPFDLALFTWSL
jgi:tRNA/tmRNA/rRNA uracil-C5-methylase (TrmA/RlmC/RlmD family)